MKKTMMALVLVALAGCSVGGGVFSSKLNVQQIGKDSYTTRATGNSATMAKQTALGAANGYCLEQKRNVQLVKETTGMEDDGSRYHDVTFLCVPAGDEDFVRVKRDALSE
jgi:hypothetical protein